MSALLKSSRLAEGPQVLYFWRSNYTQKGFERIYMSLRGEIDMQVPYYVHHVLILFGELRYQPQNRLMAGKDCPYIMKERLPSILSTRTYIGGVA